MNTLESHTLLYDKDCPLCNIYTKAFINTKMLDAKGRKSFENISENEQVYVDVDRAKDEIALIDRENKKVIYGLDSLLKVLGNSFPLIEKIGRINVVNFFLRKLYSFISYNRKVIAPSEIEENNEKACVPTFNVKYRLLFIFLSVVITAVTLFGFSNLLENTPVTNYKTELILASGQLIFQALFLLGKDKKTILNYWGNLMTVSLIGCIGLTQILILNSIVSFPEMFNLFSFFGVVLLMFFEHKRRVKLLRLPTYLTYTWAFVYKVDFCSLFALRLLFEPENYSLEKSKLRFRGKAGWQLCVK